MAHARDRGLFSRKDIITRVGCELKTIISFDIIYTLLF